MAETKVSILQLDSKYKKLEDILDYIKQENRETMNKSVLSILNQFTNLSDDDKTLIKKWKPIESTDFNIEELKFPNGSIIRYIRVKSYIESSRWSTNIMGTNGEPLPRNQRVIVMEKNGIFFESNNKVYIVLFVGNQIDLGKICKSLLDGLIDDLGHEDPGEYKVKSDFFYWLYYKQNSDPSGKINDDMYVRAISSFFGSLDDDHTLRGTGSQTPTLLGTKSYISAGHDLEALSTIINFREVIQLEFEFASSGKCVIQVGATIPHKPEEDYESLLVMYTYGFIIPLLIEAYKAECGTNWNNLVRNELMRKVGLEVVKQIIDKHGFTIEEVFGFTKQKPAS